MTVTNRAYSVLEIKSVSEDRRIIRGVATTRQLIASGILLNRLASRSRTRCRSSGSISTTSRLVS